MSDAMSTGNINWAFGDGGDVEDLADVAGSFGYSLGEDDLWRQFPDEPGITNGRRLDSLEIIIYDKRHA